MAATFSMPPNEAYESVLRVLPADQRWFAFDVSLHDARHGRATRFGMTLWNYHTLEGEFASWAITQDSSTGDFWYRVAKERGPQLQQNRKILWEALQIAARTTPRIPMNGILKNARGSLGGKKGWCDPDRVFEIRDVQMQNDDYAMWLKLAVPGGDPGTKYLTEALPPMRAIDGSNRMAAVPSLAHVQLDRYAAVRDAAISVMYEGGSRSTALDTIARDFQIEQAAPADLFNSFECLVRGTPLALPMRLEGLQIFIDAVVARKGEAVLPNIITAIESLVVLEMRTGGDDVQLLEHMLAELRKTLALASMLRTVADAAAATAKRADTPELPSEILREIWVRGPQHAAFRRELQSRWSGKCSVHGVSCNEQLRASHIVGWAKDPSLRGDVNNGLLLSVPLDSLFDQGLISFDDAGELIRSKRLHPDTVKHFGLRIGQRIAWEHLRDHQRRALRANLARHRAEHGGLDEYQQTQTL